MPIAETYKALKPSEVQPLAKKIAKLLRQHGGRLTLVAEAMGLSLSSLKRRIAALAQVGIDVRELAGVPVPRSQFAANGPYAGWNARYRLTEANRERVRELLKERGATVESVAEAMGCRPTTAARWIEAVSGKPAKWADEAATRRADAPKKAGSMASAGEIPGTRVPGKKIAGSKKGS